MPRTAASSQEASNDCDMQQEMLKRKINIESTGEEDSQATKTYVCQVLESLLTRRKSGVSVEL